MQNDMLKNNIAPWQEKGRWYHAVINADRSFDSNKTDALLLNNFIVDTATGEFFLIQSGVSYSIKRYLILDIKVILNADVTYASNNLQARYDYSYTTGRTGLYVCRSFSTGTCEIWVFIVEN